MSIQPSKSYQAGYNKAKEVLQKQVFDKIDERFGGYEYVTLRKVDLKQSLKEVFE
jgi:hypothetical protein